MCTSTGISQREAPSAPSPAPLPSVFSSQMGNRAGSSSPDRWRLRYLMRVLAALCQPHCIHEIPPSLSCSRLSPSAHSSKLQNGTNPMWSNAFLVSVFSFKGQKGKGTWCDIYEPVKLAALTRKCSQVSFLGGEGTEQAPGKGSRLCGG